MKNLPPTGGGGGGGGSGAPSGDRGDYSRSRARGVRGGGGDASAKALADLRRQVNDLREKTQAQYITDAGMRFLEATTAPFSYDSEGLAPRIPDDYGAQTATFMVRMAVNHTVPTGHYVGYVSVQPTTDDDALLYVATAANSSTPATLVTTEPERWSANKADILGAEFRVVAAGIRIQVTGAEKSAVLTPLETTSPLMAAGPAVPDVDSILDGATRRGRSFTAEDGVMSRMLFHSDFETMVTQAATQPRHLAVTMGGLTPTNVLVIEVFWACEYKPTAGAAQRPLFSPADLHYPLIRMIAHANHSDLDHSAHTLSTMLERMLSEAVRAGKKVGGAAKRVGQAALRGAALAVGSGHTADGVPISAALDAGQQQLFQELWKLLPGDAQRAIVNAIAA